MWLEAVKTYGKSPIKLFTRIKINNETKINVSPWGVLLPNKSLNSAWRVLVIFIKTMFFFAGVNQNKGVANKKTRLALSQLNEIVQKDEGSKLENKLVIIFRL